MPARAPTERETWADWLPNIKETNSEDELLNDLNRGELSISRQDLREWEEQGLLPAPIPSVRGPRYPRVAPLLVRRVYLFQQEGRPPDWIQEFVRRQADVLNRNTAPIAQTWWDWFPDEDAEASLTLDTFLEELHSRGLTDVTPRKLRSWQEARVLPLPIRRWRDGATRALFPRRAVPVVEELVTLQSLGYPLQTIRERLRGSAALQSYPDPHELQDAATALALRHQEVTGHPVRQVEIRFSAGTEGSEETYTYAVGPFADT